MKRSEINRIYREAKQCFENHGWALPPQPQWDITDFGLDRFDEYGLVLIDLTDEPEYCEKLMYARPGQRTPAHTHQKKKEDIICRHGAFSLQLWNIHPEQSNSSESFQIQVNGSTRTHRSGDTLTLRAGERITLTPGIFHEFWPESENCILGEVSTANDDTNDNIFANSDIGRYPNIEENEAPAIELISDR